MAIVKPKRHFVEVRRKMLCRYLMPRSDDPSFEQRKRRLDSVCRNVTLNVNTLAVVDGLVWDAKDSGSNDRFRIHARFVGHNHFYIAADVFLDVLRQCSRFHILSLEEPEIATPLLDAEYGNLGLFPGVDALPRLFAANVGLVHLYNAIQRPRINFLHRRTDTVTEIPCRLVGNAQHPFKLVGAHSLAGLAEQVDAEEPLPEWQVGIIEDRSGSDGKLVAAFVAIELIALCHLRNLARFATGAHNLIRPAKCFKVFAALLFAAELLNEGAKINGAFHD